MVVLYLSELLGGVDPLTSLLVGAPFWQNALRSLALADATVLPVMFKLKAVRTCR
jgi:hypothetical protein